MKVILPMVLLSLWFGKSYAVLPPEALSPICEVQASVEFIGNNKIILKTLSSEFADQGYFEGSDNCDDVFKKDTLVEFYPQPYILEIFSNTGIIVQLPIQKQSDSVTKEFFYMASDFSGYPNTHKVISREVKATDSNFFQELLLKISGFFKNLF